MGMIDTLGSIKRELSYNEERTQARYTQTQIKAKYKNDIKNTTLTYLDRYYDKYNNIDLLFYNRYEYIQYIIDDIVNDDVNKLYNDFDVALDVNESFFKIFKQFKQLKEYDEKIKQKYQLYDHDVQNTTYKIHDTQTLQKYEKSKRICTVIFVLLVIARLITLAFQELLFISILIFSTMLTITSIIFYVEYIKHIISKSKRK